MSSRKQGCEHSLSPQDTKKKKENVGSPVGLSVTCVVYRVEVLPISIHAQESCSERTALTAELSRTYQALADKDAAHAHALADKDAAHAHALADKDAAHAHALADKDAAHAHALADKDAAHAQLKVANEALRAESSVAKERAYAERAIQALDLATTLAAAAVRTSDGPILARRASAVMRGASLAFGALKRKISDERCRWDREMQDAEHAEQERLGPARDKLDQVKRNVLTTCAICRMDIPLGAGSPVLTCHVQANTAALRTMRVELRALLVLPLPIASSGHLSFCRSCLAAELRMQMTDPRFVSCQCPDDRCKKDIDGRVLNELQLSTELSELPAV
jgi:hypothetical protein